MVGLLSWDGKMPRARQPGRAGYREEYYHREVGAANEGGKKGSGFGVQGFRKERAGARGDGKGSVLFISEH
jgi:hypothetical protein